MFFQVLDNKSKCKKIYFQEKIHKDLPQGLSGTWGYCENLPHEIEYASLYCAGNPLDAVCPKNLKSEWKATSQKMRAFLNSFKQAKINLNEHCFYDLVPEHFLLNFYEIKNQITKHVLDNHEKPENYDFLLQLTKVVEDIKNRPLNLKINKLSHLSHQLATRNFLKRLQKAEKRIKYNIFGTKTGRLTTEPKSFPVLTLKKEYRPILEPNNDLYVELDFNAAELRTLLALCGKEQPKEDIHEWNAKNVFAGLQSREEAKERIFAWLYNPGSKDYLANKAYDKTSIKEKYWDGKIVTTPFGRKIEADEFHALNYLIQSTTADMVLRQVIKVHDLLKDSKSYIAFVVHDSLVIDLAKEERSLFNQIVETFSNTDLGAYKVSTSIGKNFGNMNKTE